MKGWGVRDLKGDDVLAFLVPVSEMLGLVSSEIGNCMSHLSDLVACCQLAVSDNIEGVKLRHGVSVPFGRGFFFHNLIGCVVRLTGFEPATMGFRDPCSTVELQTHY